MSRENTAGSRFAFLAYLTVFAMVAGGYALLAEVGFAEMTIGSIFSISTMFEALVFYLVFWGAVGFLVGVLSLFISGVRRGASDMLWEKTFWTSFLFSLLVFGVAGGYINVIYLPAMLSPGSLVADFLIFALSLFIWLVTFRLSRRIMTSHHGLTGLRSPLMVMAVILLGFLVYSAGVSGEQADEGGGESIVPAKDMNVLLILVDCLRPDHLGCYGYERRTSPNIDRLASEGLVFLNAYANGSRTKESTATLVTSLYPSTHNVARLSDALPEETVTLMQLFRMSGYRTAIFSANPLVSALFGFGKGVDYLYAEQHSVIRSTVVGHIALTVSIRFAGMKWASIPVEVVEGIFPPAGEKIEFQGGRSDVMNEAFLEWIGQDPGRNFFAYVHYMEPHTPYCPPSPYDTLFDPDFAEENICYPPLDPEPKLPFVEAPPVSDRELFNIIAQYDGSIAYVDHQIGRLIDELSRRGVSEKTLVFLVADHGEGLYQHKGWTHGHSVFENLIRIPAIVWCPNRVLGGQTFEMTFRMIDLMPTLLGAADIEAPGGPSEMEGRSLWPEIIRGEDTRQASVVFSEVSHADGYAARALIRDGKKIIHSKYRGTGRVMLFDLETDPDERLDLSESMPALRNDMLKELGVTLESAASKKKNTPTKVMDERLKARLRALGYIQ